MRAKLWTLAVMMAGLALPARAHDLTLQECIEGSDFIRNAALSRDYGIAREDFIGRMEHDIVAIQVFPPELRWFVQDDDDATLLIGYAQLVFDDPKQPDTHQADFLQACVARIADAAEQADAPTAVARQLEP